MEYSKNDSKSNLQLNQLYNPTEKLDDTELIRIVYLFPIFRIRTSLVWLNLIFFVSLKKWWIIIQTHIRYTDSYSDTDSENLHISLSNQWFSLNVTKVSPRIANDQIIDGKISPQKSVILPIIRGVSPA